MNTEKETMYVQTDTVRRVESVNTALHTVVLCTLLNVIAHY